MVMVLTVPKEIRSKDGVDIAEYRGGEVNDYIYTSVLKESYNLYRLFNGSFESRIVDNQDKPTEILKERLTEFFDKVRYNVLQNV